jgi:serine/threonine-protein kinase
LVFCPKDGISLRADAAGGDLIGTVIADRYLVSELLGEGGMGKVYLARHVRLPQQAAIKVLHHDMVQDAGAVARFNREAENAARIEHDRVARVFDFGETADGLVYLAMEFVPGKTLRDLLNDEGRLPAVRAADLVYQVAEGLDAAHRLKIVHRDLKPDNILVVTDDIGVDRCKVVDFGIAKVTNSSATQLTQAGMLVGTPEFMSPEQVLGEQLDGRSDVYALALVAYEMFSGELPFEGNTPERKLTARLIHDPRPLAETAPDIDWPPELQTAFDNALVREPENRTASALEFAEALVAAVEGWTGMSALRGRTPLSTTAVNTMSPTPRVNTSVSGSAPAVAPTSVATTATARSRTPGASTSQSKQAIPEPAPKKSPVLMIAAVAVLVVGGGGYWMFGRGAPEPATESPVAAVNSAPVSPTESDQSTGAVNNAGTGTPSTGNTPPVAGNVTTPPAASGNGRNTSPPPATTATPPATAANAAGDNNRGATSTAPARMSDAEAAEGRNTLGVIRSALANAPEDQLVTIGARSIPLLNQLLPKLGTVTDSTWAYLALVNAYAYAEQRDRACAPLRIANRLATSAEQRSTVVQYQNALTCAP